MKKRITEMWTNDGCKLKYFIVVDYRDLETPFIIFAAGTYPQEIKRYAKLGNASNYLSRIDGNPVFRKSYLDCRYIGNITKEFVRYYNPHA